ncbi:MAG: hypothetical protein OXH28_08790 [bacterium]|nr:hypothetical protein [bacterium]MXV90561.1 hypothetical protein [Acidimicrobiia bacterium]MYC44132.1 hypothetical protein [Acidimicrobiia bacterium]MYI19727.1 hypothetical protein [Acidimicrobiia bacterium]
MSESNASTERKAREVTPEHKAAMIQGRTETRVVRQYLEALEVRQSGGRRRSKESLQKKLAAVEEDLESADAVGRLHLVQERIDLQKAIEAAEQNVDINELESGFIDIAASYSERKSISYQAWREVGVPPKVLQAAGIR